MRKAEYIEKHGEEAWQKYLEKIRKPKKDEYIAKYGEEAWEKVLARSRKWKAENKEKHIASVRTWQENNKGKTNTYKKTWKKEHPKETRAYDLVAAYRQADIKAERGETTITADWIMDNIFNASCIYCGDSDWQHLGVDRIDNTLPHTPENCVCSCGVCNVERGNRHTVAEFIDYRKTHPKQ